MPSLDRQLFWAVVGIIDKGESGDDLDPVVCRHYQKLGLLDLSLALTPVGREVGAIVSDIYGSATAPADGDKGDASK